jgi:hypothetical protein
MYCPQPASRAQLLIDASNYFSVYTYFDLVKDTSVLLLLHIQVKEITDEDQRSIAGAIDA